MGFIITKDFTNVCPNPILEKILLGIEKVLTTFSIFNKTFPKIDLLMCALSGLC